jgi:two-component system, chemotaxis family, protein-glutamate methylesterase/glutaminase
VTDRATIVTCDERSDGYPARVRGVIVVGGSAGGVQATVDFVAGLPADLRACVLVTLHIGPHAYSRLPQILTRAGPLPAEHARDGTPLCAGTILVAPPDRHLLVVDGHARLSTGPRINRHRPAVDAMFASAARWGGPRVVAAVLSGTRDDGAVGGALVARAGGTVLAQDPIEATFPSMPQMAVATVPGTRTARARELGALAQECLSRATATPRTEADMAVEHDPGRDPGFLLPGETRLTRLACPDCGGGLAEAEVGDVSYFHCHVGHQFSPQGLEAAQRDTAETKLWAALAALEEHAVVARKLSTATGERSEEYRLAADESVDTADVLRRRLHES